MRRRERAAWLLGGVLLVALAAPSVARSVAPQLVAIVGQANQKPVTVTPANQLLASEFAPSQVVNIQAAANGQAACKPIYTVPAGKALVIETGIFSPFTDAARFDMYLFAGDHNCEANAAWIAYQTMSGPPSGTDATFEQDWRPGIIVKNGTTIYVHMQATAGTIADATIFLHGYLIPNAAAPSTPVQPAPS